MKMPPNPAVLKNRQINGLYDEATGILLWEWVPTDDHVDKPDWVKYTRWHLESSGTWGVRLMEGYGSNPQGTGPKMFTLGRIYNRPRKELADQQLELLYKINGGIRREEKKQRA